MFCISPINHGLLVSLGCISNLPLLNIQIGVSHKTFKADIFYTVKLLVTFSLTRLAR